MKIENRIKTFKKLGLTDNLADIEVESIECKDVLRIILNAGKLNIEIVFDRFVSFRLSDESKLLEYWENLQYELIDLEISIVENSSYLKEISKLSKGFLTGLDESDYIHFGIFLEDACIEVITDIDPKISYL